MPVCECELESMKDVCSWGLFRPEHSGGICRNRSLCLRTMPVSPALAGPLVWNVCEWKIRWNMGKPVFPGEWMIYPQSLRLQTWSSRVMKVTATRIAALSIRFCSLDFWELKTQNLFSQPDPSPNCTQEIEKPNHKFCGIAWLILNKHEFLRNTRLYSIRDILRLTKIQNHLTRTEHSDDWRHIVQRQIWWIKL